MISNAVTQTVGEVGEPRLVEMILATLANYQTNTLIVQPGDDAAVLSQLHQPTITADVLIEDVHFRTNWSSPVDIGTKAAAANLADLVAMGATPVALTVSIGVPKQTQVAFVLALIEAIAIEASKVSAQVVGGDVTSSDKLVVSISALGDCESRSPILRSGAKVGDQVGLIGRVGHAQTGLALLLAGKENFIELIAAHRRPSVNYAAAIAAWPAVHSMIDVSDGLIIDLNRIASASRVQVALERRLVNELITDSISQAAAELKVEPMLLILAGGEDHGFAITAPILPTGAVKLGEIKSGSGVLLDDQPMELMGYQHFSE